MIEAKVTEQGDKVRKLKADKAEKKSIDEAVTGKGLFLEFHGHFVQDI